MKHHLILWVVVVVVLLWPLGPSAFEVEYLTHNRVTLEWDDLGPLMSTTYTVLRDDVEIDTVPWSRYTDMEPTAGTTHTYQITSTPGDTAVLSVDVPAWTGTTVALTTADDFNTIVNAAAEDTRFTFATGEYRGALFYPKKGQTFTGVAGTVFNGSEVVVPVLDGAIWKVTGRTESPSTDFDSVGCVSGRANCWHPHEVFYDEVGLQRAPVLAGLPADHYFFDYDTDTVWINKDPAGVTVELSQQRWAFGHDGTQWDRTAAVSDVTISTLEVKQYAVHGWSAAIYNRSDGAESGWFIDDVTVTNSRVNSIRIYNGDTLIRDSLADSSEGGLMIGGASYIRAIDNEITGIENRSGYQYMAALYVAGLDDTSNYQTYSQVSGNHIHDGQTSPVGIAMHALWHDSNTSLGWVEDNTLEDLDAIAIQIEIADRIVVRNNTVNDVCKLRCNHSPNTIQDAAIWLRNTSNSHVYGNTVTQPGPGVDGYMLWRKIRSDESGVPFYSSSGNTFENNTFISPTDGSSPLAGIETDCGSRACEDWEAVNNTFINNTYRSADAMRFVWREGTGDASYPYTLATSQDEQQQELGSRFACITEPCGVSGGTVSGGGLQ